MLLDVLKVKEKCKTFKVIEDSQVKNLIVKIVPALAAEDDLGLNDRVDITADYFYKTTPIAGVYGSMPIKQGDNLLKNLST